MNPILPTLREHVQTPAHFLQVQLTLSRWVREIVLVGEVLQWIVVLIHLHELVAEYGVEHSSVCCMCAEAVMDHGQGHIGYKLCHLSSHQMKVAGIHTVDEVGA